jgi:hypothetical protein
MKKYRGKQVFAQIKITVVVRQCQSFTFCVPLALELKKIFLVGQLKWTQNFHESDHFPLVKTK